MVSFSAIAGCAILKCEPPPRGGAHKTPCSRQTASMSLISQPAAGLALILSRRSLNPSTLLDFTAVAWRPAGQNSGECSLRTRFGLLLPGKRPFSSEDLNDSTGRVTILGASAANVGYYKCYISASDGVVSCDPSIGSVSVDVRPQKLNIQIGTILGLWWEAFDVPNS